MHVGSSRLIPTAAQACFSRMIWLRQRVAATSTRVLLALLQLLIVLTLASGVISAPAQAHSGRYPLDLPDGAPGVTLSWSTLGLPRQVSLVSPNTNQDFTVPVPTGLNAIRLRGFINPPANLGPAYLEIDDVRGAFLATVGLPPSGVPTPTPFDVDISAARVQDSGIGLSLTLRELDINNQYCGPLPQVTLSGLSVDFAGVEPAPTTLATFFPPVLERVTVYTPADADAAERQSALTLTSTLARLYAPQPVAITAVNQPRGAVPPQAVPLTRAVVVERGTAGLEVVNPGRPDVYLRISGRGDELSNQVSLLDNRLQTLAQSVAARVEQAGSARVATGDTVTFAQLNLRGRASILRSGTLALGIDRSALGRGRVENARVQLRADYTPIDKADAASVVVRANDIVVYRSTLDSSGQLNATFDLDGQALGERIDLTFALTYSPHQGCGELISPMAFQIDPRSSITLRRGGPALEGFDALPSEFSPDFLVAFDGTSPDQLNYATRVIAQIARLTKTPLTPRVVDVKAAAEARKGALIVANSSSLKRTPLNPPLSGDGSSVTVDLPQPLRADIDRGLGSVQAFADPARDRTVVLITTTAAWNMVDPLLDYIDGLESGWPQLTGDVLAAGASGTPTELSIRTQAEPSGSSGLGLWGWVGIGALAVAVGGALAVALWRRRRRSLAAAVNSSERTVPD